MQSSYCTVLRYGVGIRVLAVFVAFVSVCYRANSVCCFFFFFIWYWGKGSVIAVKLICLSSSEFFPYRMISGMYIRRTAV